ncbi:hypothetical protein [Alicyclobacillus ferrooxydans]|uniref:Uncharacterized protein n=1 Tax=Alicyclobacillus ferrooxydans TaxID=471514 RepID=A0A0P9CG06_9BACL|nr:hypothetical protein [Alicyclobacillus ferrooxydans]KPV41956.1 hypothetical protein AN477_19455 [Alicyclobacillus ferrooxydans]
MSVVEKDFFGAIPNCLDLSSLSYKWFGCAWTEQQSRTVITGYWFGDSQSAVETTAMKAGKLANVIRARESDVQVMHSEILKAQRQQDWDNRSRLPLRVILQKPWRNASVGWYIIRSREEYPNYVSAVHKERFSVWVEHVSVCENDGDLEKFVNQVNDTHHIRLNFLDGSFRTNR